MIKNFFQAATIAIIGGADGPTTIYVAKNALPFVIAQLFFIIALTVTFVFFIKNLIRRKKRNSMIFGSVSLVLLLLVLISFFL